MPIIFTKLTKTQGSQELKKFALLAIVLSVISVFIFPILGACGCGAGIRALYVSRNAESKDNDMLTLYKLLSTLAIVIGGSVIAFNYIRLSN